MEMQNIEHKNFLDLATVARMRWSAEIDCIVSPSEPFDRHWREAFGVERVIRAGYFETPPLEANRTIHDSIMQPAGAV